MAKPVTLGLQALVALIDPPKVAIADAVALGAIRRMTEEDREWGSEELKQRLYRLRFLAADETWVEAARLVAGGGPGIEKDERLRFRLAPADRRLHEGYWQGQDDAEARMALFLLARERLQVGADDLEQWILAAAIPPDRHAALVYLSDGELGQAIAERVKAQGWLPDALLDAGLTASLDAPQVQRLQGRLASASQLQQMWQPSPPQPVAVPQLDLRTALERVARWWAAQGPAEEKLYRHGLYPAGTLVLHPDPETGRFERASWLTLLALGTFQAMGRTREAQHRGFIEHCQRRGWWQVFADLDPKGYPERWMDVIEEYAEGQHYDEEWTQWIAQFPKLYKLRRWMDDYVGLFSSIDRFTEPFTLDALLAPKTNPHFQGGGLDAPPLTRTLRVGGSMVIRELLHHKVISNRLAFPHAYAPIERIQVWFRGFEETVETSKDIHDLLCEHLGAAGATFGGAYDIPLRLVAGDEGLQERLFRP